MHKFLNVNEGGSIGIGASLGYKAFNVIGIHIIAGYEELVDGFSSPGFIFGEGMVIPYCFIFWSYLRHTP
mgnify:CR=1 FL=1